MTGFRFPAEPGSYPNTRLRRTRMQDWSRRLTEQHRLDVSDLIWPVFLQDGSNLRTPITSMPGVERFTTDLLVEAVAEAAELQIPAVALFPATDPNLKTEDAREALNPENLVCRATRAIKEAKLNIGIICDVALDPYTSHGQDGILRGNEIVNDESVAVLCEQAKVQAEAGCDMIAPSDMIRSRRRDSQNPRRRGVSKRADYVVRRQVCLGILRPFSRCGGFVVEPGKRRQTDLSNEPGKQRRSFAGSRPRHRRGGRHGNGQTGNALPRYFISRERNVRRTHIRVSSQRRIRDAGGSGRTRLAR